jgi:hypothetical protein
MKIKPITTMKQNAIVASEKPSHPESCVLGSLKHVPALEKESSSKTEIETAATPVEVLDSRPINKRILVTCLTSLDICFSPPWRWH